MKFCDRKLNDIENFRKSNPQFPAFHCSPNWRLVWMINSLEDKMKFLRKISPSIQIRHPSYWVVFPKLCNSGRYTPKNLLVSCFCLEIDPPTALNVHQYPRDRSIVIQWKESRAVVDAYYLTLCPKKSSFGRWIICEIIFANTNNNNCYHIPKLCVFRERSWNLHSSILQQKVDNMNVHGGNYTITLEARKGRYRSRTITETFVLGRYVAFLHGHYFLLITYWSRT